jgi:hypothetical protein
LYPEMHELFMDPFAYHVYKSFVRTLNGQPLRNLPRKDPYDQRKTKKPKFEDPTIVVPIPDSFVSLQLKLLYIIKQWDQTLLQTMVFNICAAILLQTIIETDLQKTAKKKLKGKETSVQKFGDIILFGKELDSDTEGIFKCYLSNI